MHVCTHCTCTCFNACTYLFQVPNAGHKAVADLEKRLTSQGRNVTVVTQNIDRLHHKAGSQNVIEMHGMSVYRHHKSGNFVVKVFHSCMHTVVNMVGVVPMKLQRKNLSIESFIMRKFQIHGTCTGA